ncbi:MAG: WD40 repeat domain-containing protein [Planctomycetia bacterium]|nr:WD40 repeat domain-containing protein [Planctomycetia bacterium]
MRIIESKNPRPLNLLAVGPDGLVAVASHTFGMQNDVEVWDATSGTFQFAPAVPYREPRSVAFTPDGKFLFVAEWQKLTVVEVATRRKTNAPPARFNFPEFVLSASGTRLLVSSMRSEETMLECWSVGDGPSCQLLWSDGPHGDYFRFPALALSADGVWAAVFERGNTGGTGGRPAHAITIRDTATGKNRVTIPTDIASPIEGLAFTIDGSKILARTHSSRTVQIYDEATGSAVGELVHTGRPYVTGMAVHPRGALACCRTNGTVCLWDVEKRELLRTFDWKAGRLVSVCFSPDGSIGAAGTEDGKVVVWDVDL